MKKRIYKGKVFSAKKMLPVELIYYEAYRDKKPAYEEKKLKYGSGLAKLKSKMGISKKERAG